MSDPNNLLNLIVVTGPTASGKTTFAAHLAHALGGEIISADSRQVYRGMDIGTGKDLDDYRIEGKVIPYHLIDIRDAGYKYNVYEFQKDFLSAFRDITQREKLPVLAGGTGLYIEAVLKGYKLIHVPVNDNLRQELAPKTLDQLSEMLRQLNPALHNTSDTDNKKRTIRAIEIATYYQQQKEVDLAYPSIHPLIFGTNVDRESRRQNITKRLRQRLEEGMIAEVEKLLQTVPADDLIFYGLEYKFITQHLIGELTYEEMFDRLEVAIHQFAKRQMTWFRKMEREGTQIHWLDVNWPMEQKLSFALELIKQRQRSV